MHKRRRIRVALVAAVLAVPGWPGTARADDDGVARSGIRYRDHTLIVTAGAPGSLQLTTEPGRGGKGPTLYCGWFEIRVGGRPLISLIDAVDPVEGETYLLNCWTEQLTRPFAGYPIAAPYPGSGVLPGSAVSTGEAARHAVDQIRFEVPKPELSPPGRQIVGVPTWLAVSSKLDYEPISAEAGPVWATVRPEFRDVVWELGNGETIRCSADAARRWDAPHAGSAGCAHTFESTIESDTAASRRGRVTVRWTIHETTDKTGGRWEVWGTVAISAPLRIEIDQLQAAIR